MDDKITWLKAAQLRANGVILDPQWQYVDEVLQNLAARQKYAFDVYNQADTEINHYAQIEQTLAQQSAGTA